MRTAPKITLLFLFLFSLAISGSSVFAETEAELRQKIEAKNKEIETLEKEIGQYQKQIVDVGERATTLKGALNALELSRKKLTADITVTQKKIDSVNLTIQSLKFQIGDKEERIVTQKTGLAQTIKEIADADETSLLEALLTYEDLGDFWNISNNRESLQKAIQERVKELVALRDDLNDTKKETELQKRKLENLKIQLSDQRKIVEDNKAQTDKLLKDTQNKESNYKKILADKQAARIAYQQEVNNYEAQLKLIIDPNSFPRPGSGILSWPTDAPYVTQEFGDTAFSRQNPQAYNGKGHNGIDLRAAPGTPIKAALAGVVLGTGNTDSVCPGASYGKWVLIKHANGLTTLYAHLSLIKVGEGQNVATRELIGYSGSTGYATGPHLHFSLYASEGVKIATLKSRVCGGTYTLPVADLKAYLNPTLYL